MDSQTQPTQSTQINFSLAYYIYVFGIGIGYVCLMVYWGFVDFSFVSAVALGGLIQVIFRISKRIWRNHYDNTEDHGATSRNVIMRGFIETLSSLKLFAILYCMMVLVSSFWYGLGRLFGWLLS